MTIEELWYWAVENRCEDMELAVAVEMPTDIVSYRHDVVEDCYYSENENLVVLI